MKTMINRTYFTIMETPNLLDHLQQIVSAEPRGVKLLKALATKYEFNWILYQDTEVSPWNPTEIDPKPDEFKIKQWENRFRIIYNNTKDRYLKLFELYEANENNLLNKLERSSTTKFNDTPQNVEDAAGMKYVSNLTETTSSVDPNEIINRLANIRRNYADLMSEWIEEFSPLFGESLI